MSFILFLFIYLSFWGYGKQRCFPDAPGLVRPTQTESPGSEAPALPPPHPATATMVVHAVLEYLPQALAVLPLEDILKLVSHTPFMSEDLGQRFLPEPPEAEDAGGRPPPPPPCTLLRADG